MNEENYGKRNPFMDDPAPGYEQPSSRIDWKIEIQKAEQWSKKECCAKYIDLAKQIADEANAYKSMWEAEFKLRRNCEAKFKKSNSRVMNKPFRPEMEADVF